MSPGTFILLWVLIGIILVIATVKALFRVLTNKFGNKDLIDEGIVLTQSGIEFPRFLFVGRTKVSYSDIESAKFVPFPESLTLRIRYGPSIKSQVSGRWLA